jgi:nitrate reductase delta subunit
MGPVMEKTLYSHLAGLLRFPKEDLRAKAGECIRALAMCPQYPPEVGAEMKNFADALETTTLDDLQGVFSYTFELSSDYTMDLGYHLFDGFKRSNHLASIMAMYRESGFPYAEVAGGELPDHLPVVLEFLGFCPDKELVKNVRESFLIKALEKLNKNFERNKRNIYSHIIGVIYGVIDKDVKEVG